GYDRFGSSATEAVEAKLKCMSASLQKRTSERLPRYVRLVPIATECAAAKTNRYSITSLAAETKLGGSASPKAWAVRRLITKSNCEVALMGRSPGLAQYASINPRSLLDRALAVLVS